MFQLSTSFLGLFVATYVFAGPTDLDEFFNSLDIETKVLTRLKNPYIDVLVQILSVQKNF